MTARRLLVALVAGAVLAGCAESSRPGPGQSPDVDTLTVTGSEPVEIPGSASLSPTGERLLLTSTAPCVRRLDGSDEVCVDTDRVAPDAANAAWSPDGTQLAFTDDFWRLANEPDLWVFDVTTGVLRNLTDDGEDKIVLSGPNENADIDLLPSWSADAETIRFVRGRAKAESVELMSVPAGGGEPSTIRTVDCATTDVAALAWSDSRVAWSCGLEGAEVFLADHADGTPERVLPGDGAEDRMLLSFSPDGQWLLVDSLRQYGQYTALEGGQAVIVPADGGDPVPVADQAGFPTWSPEGHALAYVALPDRLMIAAEPGAEPRELRTAEKTFGAADGRRLAWTHDHLLVQADQEPALLTLATE
ncbi:hypothetical protein [Actinophytocola sediminis]